jgi:hypothetical protein
MKRGVLVALLVAIAIALSACEGYTDPPTNVTSASATLRGHVSCEAYDGPIHWWWEYRKDGGPWQQTPHMSYNCTSSISNASVSKNLTGLVPDSHYDFVLAGYDDDDPQAIYYGAHTHWDSTRRPPFDGLDTDPPPDTSVTSGPSGFVNSASASFGFSSIPSGVPSFECRLDSSSGGTWQSCSSPKSYGGLADGSHIFEVRAKDAAGTLDPSPASRSWTVDTTAPTIELSGTLKDAADLSETLGESSYGLTVTSSDGQSSSGVKSIEILIDDGETNKYAEQACQEGSCSMSLDWTLETQDFSGGDHPVTVVVQDHLGQQREQSFTVTLPADSLAVPDTLPCTESDEPPNFQTYSLGAIFDGLPVTAVLRECDDLYPGEVVRANYVSYIYGDCIVLPDLNDQELHGCAPPLEVQSWPACERTLSDYEFAPGVPYPHDDRGLHRGVPAFSFDLGSRVELYPGATTVAVFGDDPEQIERALLALRPEPGTEPPHIPSLLDLNSGSDLPPSVPGATEGTLSCSS